MQDDLPKQLLILLEEKLKDADIQRVDEFEAFLENIESWCVSHLTDLNRDKKLIIHRANVKLEKIAANSIADSLSRMDDDERKHFVMKNQ